MSPQICRYCGQLIPLADGRVARHYLSPYAYTICPESGNVPPVSKAEAQARHIND